MAKSTLKTEIKKFAKTVADEFLADLDDISLQSLTQDEIDAFVIPVMTEVEDVVNEHIAVRIKNSFEVAPLGEEDEWWPDNNE